MPTKKSPLSPPRQKCTVPTGRVLLWEKAPIACHCLTLADGHIEVTLTSCDHEIHRAMFTESDDAARFAVDKMHAYDAR